MLLKEVLAWIESHPNQPMVHGAKFNAKKVAQKTQATAQRAQANQAKANQRGGIQSSSQGTYIPTGDPRVDAPAQANIAQYEKYRQAGLSTRELERENAPRHYDLTINERLEMSDSISGYKTPSQPSPTISSTDSVGVGDEIKANVIRKRNVGSDDEIESESIADNKKQGRDLAVTLSETLGITSTEKPPKTPSQMSQVGGVPSFLAGGIQYETGLSPKEIIAGTKKNKAGGRNLSISLEETLGFGTGEQSAGDEWQPKYFERGTMPPLSEEFGRDYFKLDSAPIPTAKKESPFPFQLEADNTEPNYIDPKRAIEGQLSPLENIYTLSKDVYGAGKEQIEQGKIDTGYQPKELKKDIFMTPLNILIESGEKAKGTKSFQSNLEKGFGGLASDIKNDPLYWLGNVETNVGLAVASGGIAPVSRVVAELISTKASKTKAKGILELLHPPKTEKIDVWDVTGKSQKYEGGDLFEYKKGTKDVPFSETFETQRTKIPEGVKLAGAEGTGQTKTQSVSPIETIEKVGKAKGGYDIYQFNFKGDEGKYNVGRITMTPDPVIEYINREPFPTDISLGKSQSTLLRLDEQTGKKIQAEIKAQPSKASEIFKKYAIAGTGGDFVKSSLELPKGMIGGKEVSGSYLADIESGKIYQVTPETAKMLGARRTELLYGKQYTFSELYGATKQTKNPFLIEEFRTGKVKDINPFILESDVVKQNKNLIRYGLDPRTFAPEDLGKPFTLELDETKAQVKKGTNVKGTKDVSKEVFDTDFGRFDFEKESGFNIKAEEFKPDITQGMKFDTRTGEFTFTDKAGKSKAFKFGKTSIEDMSARGGNILGGKVPRETYYEKGIDELVNADIESWAKTKSEVFGRDVSEYGVKDKRSITKIFGTKEWVDEQADLWIANTDWSWEGTNVKGELGSAKQSVKEGAQYWMEKDFGFDEPPSRPKNKAEEIGEALFEPFRRMKDEELAQIPSRESDFFAGRKYMDDYVENIFGQAESSLEKVKSNKLIAEQNLEKSMRYDLPIQKGKTLKVNLENMPEQPITFEQGELQIGYPETTMADTSNVGRNLLNEDYGLNPNKPLSKKQQLQILKEFEGFESAEKDSGMFQPELIKPTKDYGFGQSQTSPLDVYPESSDELDLFKGTKDKDLIKIWDLNEEKSDERFDKAFAPIQDVKIFQGFDEKTKIKTQPELDIGLVVDVIPTQDQPFRFRQDEEHLQIYDELLIEKGTTPFPEPPPTQPEIFPVTDLPMFDIGLGGGALGSWDDSFGKGGKEPQYWNADPENVLGFFKSDIGYQGKEFSQLGKASNKDFSGYDTFGFAPTKSKGSKKRKGKSKGNQMFDSDDFGSFGF